MDKINKTKIRLFEKTNKIDKLPVRQIRKKRKIQLINIKNENTDIITDSIGNLKSNNVL